MWPVGQIVNRCEPKPGQRHGLFPTTVEGIVVHDQHARLNLFEGLTGHARILLPAALKPGGVSWRRLVWNERFAAPFEDLEPVAPRAHCIVARSIEVAREEHARVPSLEQGVCQGQATHDVPRADPQRSVCSKSYDHCLSPSPLSPARKSRSARDQSSSVSMSCTRCLANGMGTASREKIGVPASQARARPQ